MKLLLRDEGVRILTAESAEDGLRLLARNTVDVVISDLDLGSISGAEFLSRTKELYPDAVRMVLSGCTQPALINDAIKRGALYKFLTKPWNNARLRETVRQAFLLHSESDSCLQRERR